MVASSGNNVAEETAVSTEVYEGLGRRLQQEYPRTAAEAWKNLTQWLEGNVPLVPGTALRDFLDGAPLDLIHESFWRSIPFGTGGVRGTVGFGPNRINPTVVALTIQAHCNFLNDLFATGRGEGLERSVVIANDVREFHDLAGVLKFLEHNPYHATMGDPGLRVTSRSLAYLAAGVYAKNGYLVYMLKPGDDEAFLTTPELSFLIRWLHAAGGINLSASHNPPDDNGVKVYDEKGGQYLPPDDQDLTDRTRNIREASHMPYKEAVAAGLVKDVPSEALDDYMSLYMDRAHSRGLGSEKDTRILFTPLGGCGGRTVKVGLDKLGYAVHMPEREGPKGTGPDGTRGTFGTIPMRIANPEVPESTRQSKIAAHSFGATLVLASDPDADRLGVEVYHQGEWRHLTGNQIATILAYYLLLDQAGPRLNGAVYETAVTTLAVEEIANRAKCKYVRSDLLVGFKYIGHEVFKYQKLEPTASDEELLAFATEESHGYLDTPKIRDKDAMSGALYLAKLHERLAASNETLVDYLARAYEEVGRFGDTGRSIIILGSRGFRAIQDVMQQLRNSHRTTLAGVRIEQMTDRRDPSYGPRDSDTDWEARNLLAFWFAEGRISFRPSGTEPKLKFYVQTKAAPAGINAQEYADAIAGRVYQELLGILNEVYEEVALDDAFASLPDVIPLEGKIQLQGDVSTKLYDLVSRDDFRVEFTAQWLNERVGSLVPGESAWEVTESALRSVASQWGTTGAQRVDSVFAYLREHLR
jgi:phosphoglucomutase